MVEVLAPIGDFEGLAAAIKAGADAVYFGIKGLNMRSGSAKNFTIEEMKEVADRCHAHNMRCYLTLNTIVYNHEFPRVEMILKKIKEFGVDAIIATDMGVISRANELGVEVHISTQASIGNMRAAKFYSQFAPRLVLARELSLEQTKKMKEDLLAEGINIELEIFVHGALCVAESGRCFMSQFHNRISANRGQCLQECRREYKVTDVEDPRREFILDNNFVMSPKDLCALPILDKVLDAGVDVLKIEGRAKGPEYIYKVTKVYREAVDALTEGTFTPEKVVAWLEELQKVYNRGLTDNFLLGTATNDSWSGIYGSKAKYIKQRIGKVIHYFPKAGMAEILLEKKTITKGDTIAITGPTTGYYEGVASSIRTDEHGIVNSATETRVTIPVAEIVRRNDKVFVIIENHISEAEEKISKFPAHEPFKTAKKETPQNIASKK